MAGTVRLYARVSTEDQVETGFSMDDQKERLLAWARSQGLERVAYYEDPGISGLRADRPGLQAMMAALERDDTVVVVALSRLSRRTTLTLQLAEQIEAVGANLTSITEIGIDTRTPMGKVIFTFIAAIAQSEAETLRMRSMQGRTQAAKQGYWPSGTLPYGYGLEDGRLAPLEPSAGNVRLIFELAASRSLSEIRLELKKRGLPSPNGQNEWEPSTIARVLSHTAYKGEALFRGSRYTRRRKGPAQPVLVSCPALVTETVWAAAQRFARPRAQPSRYPNGAALLTGRVRCQQCGHAVVRRATTSERAYYRCRASTANGQHACSDRTSLRVELGDEQARVLLAEALTQPEALKALATSQVSGGDERDRERARLEAELERVRDMYQAGIITSLSEVQERHRDINARLARLGSKITVKLDQAAIAKAGKVAQAVQQSSTDELAQFLDDFRVRFALIPNAGLRLVSLEVPTC